MTLRGLALSHLALGSPTAFAYCHLCLDSMRTASAPAFYTLSFHREYQVPTSAPASPGKTDRVAVALMKSCFHSEPIAVARGMQESHWLTPGHMLSPKESYLKLRATASQREIGNLTQIRGNRCPVGKSNPIFLHILIHK